MRPAAALRTATSLLLVALVALAATGCGGGGAATDTGDGGDASGDRASGVTPRNPEPPTDDGPDDEPPPARHDSPLVLDADDVDEQSFPLTVVDADGNEREVATRAELDALLAGGGPRGADPPEVEYVRLLYATDRDRETGGAGTYVRPLVPGLAALVVAGLATWVLVRALRVELRNLAWAAGGLFLLCAVGTLARGAWIDLELLRLAHETDVIYGSERSSAGRLEYGTVLVAIPAQVHEIARVERPSLLRGELFADPTKHFTITDVEVLEEDAFFADLRARVEASPRRSACVFVHGYNNTFSYAALRLAQIVYDVGFEGAPILYSWPSKGAVALYTHDKENADWSAGNLAQFLRDLRARSGADRIHLIAHSMGSRVLANAISDVAADAEGARLFDELVLAAPDIDSDTFRRFIAPTLIEHTGRVTLYASTRDEALLASVQVNGQRRAGMAGPGMVVLDGMDTVDVSHVAGGHAYISDSGRVLVDLVEIVRHRRDAESRSALAARELGGRRYWEMIAD